MRHPASACFVAAGGRKVASQSNKVQRILGKYTMEAEILKEEFEFHPEKNVDCALALVEQGRPVEPGANYSWLSAVACFVDDAVLADSRRLLTLRPGRASDSGDT